MPTIATADACAADWDPINTPPRKTRNPIPRAQVPIALKLCIILWWSGDSVTSVASDTRAGEMMVTDSAGIPVTKLTIEQTSSATPPLIKVATAPRLEPMVESPEAMKPQMTKPNAPDGSKCTISVGTANSPFGSPDRECLPRDRA